MRCTARDLVLRLPEAQRHLTDKAYADRLRAALDDATGVKLRLDVELASGAEASLAAQARRERAEQKAKTEAQFRDEPFVREVVARFDAKIRPDSIKRVSSTLPRSVGPAHGGREERRRAARSIHR